ncbi:MAG: N-6 DNA methylase [Rikenellaceae bacterium]
MDEVREVGQTLSVSVAAERLGVCGSTIRNWVRSGLLERVDGGVALGSVERFESEEVGRGRLTSRANKSQKEGRKGRKGRKRDSKAVEYDRGLSEAQRNKEGVYYTPTGTIQNIYKIFEGEDLSCKTLLDPCCGSGNFLIEALDKGFAPEHIFGYEIDPEAARIARRRIYERTGVHSRNIICGDFLEVAHRLRRRFDYCITNPPWGRRIDRRQRRRVAALYGAAVNDDSSSIFLRAAMGVTREGGVVSFLVQEALFTVRAHEALRRYLFDYNIVRLVDHGRVFPSLLTSALSVTLRKEPSQGSILCEVLGSDGGAVRHSVGGSVVQRVVRSRESFLCNPNLIFNIWASEADAALIERLYSLPYITLRGAANWGLGIVTGDNSRYVSTTPKEGFVEVVKGGDILPEVEGDESSDGELAVRWGEGQIARGRHFINSDVSLYQQVAPIGIYAAPEKLIYRFISSRLSFAVDRSQLLTLNSANNLVLNESFPLTAQQLAQLLNSDFMNRLFRTIFHTRKVLRGDLEALPIFAEQIPRGEPFDEKSYIEALNVAFGLEII